VSACLPRRSRISPSTSRISSADRLSLTMYRRQSRLTA
jgi:hypothetical protein